MAVPEGPYYPSQNSYLNWLTLQTASYKFQ